ncbi:glutathione S-transferase family protein [Photobacterium galatheae]|uniref:Glutathione S-transferase n=1 Tax=Photobacterium galatheae TaxID=1654360 RepID=A0A066RZU7_9GAMM|nr:glutathione S-transferase family protein [Photobacterium galatheae]KDM93172.1 glutathione S-transferase [Photobacterium galatheae]MCM0148299.1 glutathione S-transferase family protein [Photobacterium galatheae]
MSDLLAQQELVLFHSPQSRSSSVLILLKELGVPFHLHAVNILAGENRQAEYLAVNPLGKVPAVLHGEALITEQVAIYLYLTDLYAAGELAPALDDPLRGPYLRWMLYYAACYEPAVCDRAMGWVPQNRTVSPYTDYDTVNQTLTEQLSKGPYLLGERFTAADLLWANSLDYCMAFGLVDPDPVLTAYVQRVVQRPSFAEVKAEDVKLVALHEAANQAGQIT